MKLKFFQAIILIFLLPLALHSQINGKVVSENNEPLAGVTIFNADHAIGTSTDINGNFYLDTEIHHPLTLEISYIGYEVKKIIVESTNRPVNLGLIILYSGEFYLETVTVNEEFSKNESSLSGYRINETFFDNNIRGSFAGALEKLPGISAINVGVGIGKPVIRGLSSNRIIVNQNGIKQESQQWASDHGLEVDPFDVDRVEIVKGPATIQYGSDGLGGVINIKSGEIPAEGELHGSLTGLHKTNNSHWGGTAKVALNKKNFFFSGRFTRQSFGDYQVPSDRFEYNGFVLPIINNRLKNTAGREQNISLGAGYSAKNHVTRLSFNHYQLNAGIFAGAVGFPRAYTLEDDGNYRNIETPKQEVDHYRLTLNHSVSIGEDHLNINLGYQKNVRGEFSIPEFHNIPSSTIDFNDQLALALELNTYTANIHYEKLLQSDKIIYGADIQWQQNTRAGFEYLLPDFQTLRSGVFLFYERRQNDKLIVNGGIRADIGQNKTIYSRQYIWDSNETIIDSLVSEATNNTFYNWSASLGLNYNLKEKTLLRLNIAKSFRIPYPSETSANGIHHGTFRHEQGTKDLTSEDGYQLDLSISHGSERFSIDLSSYFNFFKNYIYLGPSFPARFSSLPEAGQIFRYRQDDAIYTGFEIAWSYKISKTISWRQSGDFIRSYNLNTGLALPFTPQPSLKNELEWHTGQIGIFKNPTAGAEYQYFMAAKGISRVDRSERETPAAQLINIHLGFEVTVFKQKLLFNFQVQNAFNTYYLNHLSRYRLINVPEQGRNFILSMKIPFSAKI